MDYKQILDDIKKNKLKKVYLCYGSEVYLIDWILSQIKNKYVDKSFESLNYIHLDGKETTIDNIINACETLPLMSDKKIVVVEDLVFITSGKSGNSSEEKQLSEYLLNLNDSTCLIFTIREEKIDSRKKIVKNIKKVGSVIKLDKIKGEELKQWISKSFRKRGKQIDNKGIYYLIELSGYLESKSNKTLYDLENEIIKISNYLEGRKRVTNEDIDKVLVRSLQNNIFKLVDGIGQRKTDVALSLLNEMILENEPIQLILHMIIRQFRLILMAKMLEKKGYSQGIIAKKMGVHNFVAKKVISQSRNFTTKELENGLKSCLETDKKIKKGNMNDKLAVEMLIISFCNKIL
ncbi:DNA polymerase III subunit delta [Thermohalobacter berrensis]|uniref:DNA polymerase III subunit delta n=1 Tax=Thermohalobacter berrensis TaxID=99594 RepID=A0A419T0A7_9FIRM|nr:DNA polymerase III subunit delta [Thermohalobacter berrensis]RKD30869.1 DNA polymerase III subunit delta [Thermohalobacter berrensis]